MLKNIFKGLSQKLTTTQKKTAPVVDPGPVFHPETPEGIKEFFPKDLKQFKEGTDFGRSWLRYELRRKSSLDLHKLWYVLLKEKNMLLTMEHEATQQEKFVRPLTRKYNVVVSMRRIRSVIAEREQAINRALLLQEKASLKKHA